MRSWLRGRAGRVAVSFGGRVVRYGELARAIDAVDAVGAVALESGSTPVACPVGMDPVEMLVTVLACLERGRPVLVGGDRRLADAIAADVPPGADLLLTTSGSSDARGVPRVVARTSASWQASADPLSDLTGLDDTERVGITGPLHVSMHLYAALHALRLGATVVDRADQATVVHATPTRLARLVDHPSVPDAAIIAGAALSDTLRERAVARDIRVIEYYGAAELSFVLADTGRSLAPFPGVEIDLRRAEVGDELWVRSPYVALGVIGGALRRDADGWTTVGDLAEHTPAGSIRVLGRGDAAITTAGATVLAEPLEARIGRLEGVRAAAVLGEPHELLGQQIVAIIELEPDADVDAIAASARRALSPVELPRRWFAGELPRTASGKLARGILREALDAGDLGVGFPAHVGRVAVR